MVFYQEISRGLIWGCINHYAYSDAVFLAERVHTEVNSLDTLHLLAHCYYRCGKLSHAYGLLSQNESMAMQSADCRLLMGRVCFELRRLDDALDWLSKRLTPNDSSNFLDEAAAFYGDRVSYVFQLLGRIYVSQGKQSEARIYLYRSIQLNPLLWTSFTMLCQIDGNDSKLARKNIADLFSLRNDSHLMRLPSVDPYGESIHGLSAKEQVCLLEKLTSSTDGCCQIESWQSYPLPSASPDPSMDSSALAGVLDEVKAPERAKLSVMIENTKNDDKLFCSAQRKNPSMRSLIFKTPSTGRTPSGMASQLADLSGFHELGSDSLLSLNNTNVTPTFGVLPLPETPIANDNETDPHDAIAWRTRERLSVESQRRRHSNTENAVTPVASSSSAQTTHSIIGDTQNAHALGNCAPVKRPCRRRAVPGRSTGSGVGSITAATGSISLRSSSEDSVPDATRSPSIRRSPRQQQFRSRAGSNVPNTVRDHSTDSTGTGALKENTCAPRSSGGRRLHASGSAVAGLQINRKKATTSSRQTNPCKKSSIFKSVNSVAEDCRQTLVPTANRVRPASGQPALSSRNTDEPVPSEEATETVTSYLGTELGDDLEASEALTSCSCSAAELDSLRAELEDRLFSLQKQSLTNLLNLLANLAEGCWALSRYQLTRANNIFESRVVEPHRSSAFVLTRLALSYQEKKNFDKAINLYQAARSLAPYRLDGMEHYSTALWFAKRDVELAALAHQLYSLPGASSSPEFWCCVGNCFSMKRERENSVRFLLRATQVDPDFAYAYSLLGSEHCLMEKYEDAYGCHNRAIALNPRAYYSHFGLSMAYFKQERFQEAQTHVFKAVNCFPNSPELLCQQAQILYETKQPKKALAVLERSLRFNPTHAASKFYLASILASMGRDDEALKHLEELKVIEPHESLVHFLMGRIHHRRNSTVEYMACFQATMDLDPKGTNNSIKQMLDRRYLASIGREDNVWQVATDSS